MIARQSLPHTLVEVRTPDGSLVTEQNTIIYQVLGTAHRGTYEQLSVLYEHLNTEWIGIIACCETTQQLLVHHPLTDVWHNLTQISHFYHTSTTRYLDHITYGITICQSILCRLERDETARTTPQQANLTNKSADILRNAIQSLKTASIPLSLVDELSAIVDESGTLSTEGEEAVKEYGNG